jgi:hypothetical protein
MNCLWISGWSVPPDWLAAQAAAVWPRVAHRAVAVADAESALAAGNYDALGGYSLGTLWLLRQAEKIPAPTPVVLIAPILAFPAEDGKGGRISRAQLRAQRRDLREDAPAAVLAFARLAGLAELGIPAPPDEFNPTNVAALDAGLGWLETWTASAPPASWQGWVGEADPLLDAAQVHEHWPAVRVVPGAGHAPGPLLRAAAAEFTPFASTR